VGAGMDGWTCVSCVLTTHVSGSIVSRLLQPDSIDRRLLSHCSLAASHRLSFVMNKHLFVGTCVLTISVALAIICMILEGQLSSARCDATRRALQPAAVTLLARSLDVHTTQLCAVCSVRICRLVGWWGNCDPTESPSSDKSCLHIGLRTVSEREREGTTTGVHQRTAARMAARRASCAVRRRCHTLIIVRHVLFVCLYQYTIDTTVGGSSGSVSSLGDNRWFDGPFRVSPSARSRTLAWTKVDRLSVC
jgi:hypothetical protein